MKQRYAGRANGTRRSRTAERDGSYEESVSMTEAVSSNTAVVTASDLKMNRTRRGSTW